MLTKILIYITAGLLALVVGMAFYSKYEHNKYIRTKAQISQLNSVVNQLNKTIKLNNEVNKNTDKIVSKVIKTTQEATKKTEQINRQVDNANEQVKSGKITPAHASSIYSNSMWTTYCQAEPTDYLCPARQPSGKL